MSDAAVIALLIAVGAISGSCSAWWTVHCIARKRRRQQQADKPLTWTPPFRGLNHNPPPTYPRPPTPAGPPREPSDLQGKRLQALARNLLDPDMFGHAVSQEVRDAARHALGINNPKASNK